MKTFKTATLALATMGLIFASGCDRHDKKEVFYLISVNSTMSYWQTLANGFNKAAADYKVTAKVVGPDNYDPQGELAELQKAVAAKPAGILIQAADAAVLKPGIDAAVAAGIPVITVDSDASDSSRLYFIGTNNLEAGRVGGKHLAQKLGGKGNVIFYSFTGQPNIDDRLQGFKDALSAYPGIKIVEVVDVKADRNAAFDRTQQFMALSGAQKIDAFVSLEATSGKIVADAVKRANGSDRIVMAWDVSQDTLDEVKSGSIEATIAQKPFTMGYYGLKALDEVFHNPPAQLSKDNAADSFSHYPVFVDTGTSLVDKNNADAYIAAAAAK
jgi:ABC-type sugar transport system, periplasmic component